MKNIQIAISMNMIIIKSFLKNIIYEIEHKDLHYSFKMLKRRKDI